jgi:hypothetical protein
MTKRQRQEMNQFVRAKNWADKRATDFSTAKPPVLAKFTATGAKLGDAIAGLEKKAALQASGSYGEETESQGVLRGDVEETLRDYNRTAASISEEKKDPSIMDRFRMPTGGGDEDLRTKLRAFADAIEDLGLVEAFEAIGHDAPAAELRQMAEDFRGSEGEQGDALAQQVGATQSIPELIREGRGAVKTFNAMFSLFYKGNVGMLAEWKSASRLERDGGGDAEGGTDVGSSAPVAQPAPAPVPA